MSWVFIEGVRLDYTDTGGSGEPVLLIHGHPFDRTMWRPQIEYLAARGHRAIAADLRGYGHSTVVPAVTGLETFARDLAGLLDHLGVRRAVVCGLSMGGQVALELHRLRPEKIGALVLADTSAAAETPAGHRSRHATADRLLREGLHRYAEELLGTLLSEETLRHRPEVATHVREMMRATSPLGAAAALRGRAERPDHLPRLGTIRVPTLVIVGERDELTPVADAAAIATGVPGARLEIVEGAGHLPNLEQPARFNRLLNVLLERPGHGEPLSLTHESTAPYGDN